MNPFRSPDKRVRGQAHRTLYEGLRDRGFHPRGEPQVDQLDPETFMDPETLTWSCDRMVKHANQIDARTKWVTRFLRPSAVDKLALVLDNTDWVHADGHVVPRADLMIACLVWGPEEILTTLVDPLLERSPEKAKSRKVE